MQQILIGVQVIAEHNGIDTVEDGEANGKN